MTALEAYALAKKVALSAVSGVRNLSVDGTKLLIETNDGNTLELEFPTPEGIKIGYYDKNNDKFYKNSDLTGEIQGKDELLYIDKNKNKLYYWNNEGDSDKFQLLVGGENKIDYDENDFDFDEENQILSLKSLRRFFIGTQAEWDALTVQQRQKYSLVHILDDSTSGGGGGYKLVSSVASDGVKSYKTLFIELMENVTISSDKTYLLKIFGNSPLYHETSRPTSGGKLGFYQTFNTGKNIFTDNIMLSKISSEVVYIQSGNDVADMVPKNGTVVKLFSISVDSAI